MNISSKLVIIRGAVGAGKTSVVDSLRDRLGDVSIIDFDAFKRQIDNTKSSAWRREIAVDTALYLCERIMQKRRDVVVDIHSSQINLYEKYVKLAEQHGYEVLSFMLHPPLEVCIQRAKARFVPDITYKIDATMIKAYWNDAVFIENEIVFRDAALSADQIADKVINTVFSNVTQKARLAYSTGS